MTDGPIAKLVAAYPDFLASHDANALIWKDGTVMILDDGKGEKDPETRLNEPDLKDMFYAPYPKGRSGIPPELDCDPGRVRYQPFFDKMYGNCEKGEVKPKLVQVTGFPGTAAECSGLRASTRSPIDLGPCRRIWTSSPTVSSNTSFR
jgi:hypothetical protein